MDYTISQDRTGSWYVHPVGRKKEKVGDDGFRLRMSALQRAAECMSMSYGEYMAYREKHLAEWNEKPYVPPELEKRSSGKQRDPEEAQMKAGKRLYDPQRKPESRGTRNELRKDWKTVSKDYRRGF